jgi:hypothetical protein
MADRHCSGRGIAGGRVKPSIPMPLPDADLVDAWKPPASMDNARDHLFGIVEGPHPIAATRSRPNAYRGSKVQPVP